jgi:predicted Zn-dependent peptidase
VAVGRAGRRYPERREATLPTPGSEALRVRTSALAPGVRAHVLSTDRFTTSVCRVVLHRDLGPEATATSLLAQTLESATARHPTREALAHRLADLYGAGLSVRVEKMGDRQLLAASLEWPSVPLPGRKPSVEEGLSFLREVLTEPKRGKDGLLDADVVAVEARNLVRSLEAIRDDKARYALRRCLETACVGEPYALDAEGRVEDVPPATPRVLSDLHARLVRTAPVEVFFSSHLDPERARSALRRHLLWEGRSRVPAPVPPVASVRSARARPARVVEADAVVQGKMALAFRAPLLPNSPLAPAALAIAGILGGTSVSRLFKVVRETHGLCYYASASWLRAKGLMIVQSGVEPANEPRARRLILRLAREVAGGRLEPRAWEAVREGFHALVRAIRDDRGAAIGFAQEMTALHLDPRPESHARAMDAVRPSDVRRAGRALRLDSSFFLAPEGAGGEAA